MPWTPAEFKDRHNHGLSPAQAAHASRQANAILRSGAPEGIAIATANEYAQHHRDAGGGIGGVTPSTQAQNPMIQGMIQRYASLPTEKLAELAGQMGNSPQGSVIQRLLMQRRMQPQNSDPAMQQQPQAAAPQPMAAPAPAGQARGGELHRAGGGDMGVSPSQASPWWTRSEARQDASQPALGFLHGSTPGRGDQIDTTAPAGSHVIPADVVAGLGEGNSLAGAARMEKVISTGPRGIPLPRMGGGHGPPRPPAAPHNIAKGGEVDQREEEPEEVPVKLSHGEYVVNPEHVLAWGKGDRKAGHNAWDAWIVHERKKQIKKLQTLKGPVKS